MPPSLSKLVGGVLTSALGQFVKEECFQVRHASHSSMIDVHSSAYCAWCIRGPNTLSPQEDSFQVGIWSGHVELHNVELKPDCLDFLGLPVTLRYARYGQPSSTEDTYNYTSSSPTSRQLPIHPFNPYPRPPTPLLNRVGLIEVTVPWTQLGKRPLVIKLEGISVLVQTKYELDEASNARRLDAIKQAKLKVAESAPQPSAGEAGKGGPPKPDFSSHWAFHRVLNR